MIGLDTNILVRYIIQDDDDRAKLARQLIESLSENRPAHVSLIALAELCWVLTQRYKITRNDLLRVVDWLLESTELLIEAQEQVAEARDRFSNTNADFGDCLIYCCSVASGCNSIMTFDKIAAKSAGMTLLI